ncbi:hypothetical protein HK100_009890 [Physocladia obscura]|uniref:Uncharacterized protein n=1 Tax=Physocladia obscura TaxID=109957 RepID=A0AAD5XE10_9FUNG|nr:hypothetical protein HK100_009890 [Physocladia obscura]
MANLHKKIELQRLMADLPAGPLAQSPSVSPAQRAAEASSRHYKLAKAHFDPLSASLDRVAVSITANTVARSVSSSSAKSKASFRIL